MTEIVDESNRKMRVKLFAAIVRRSKIIFIEQNGEEKTDTFQFNLSNESYGIPHAEIKVIKKTINIYGEEFLSKSSIYIIRRKQEYPGGSFIYGLAKPCSICTEAIKKYKIRRIIYSTNEQDFAYLNKAAFREL